MFTARRLHPAAMALLSLTESMARSQGFTPAADLAIVNVTMAGNG